MLKQAEIEKKLKELKPVLQQKFHVNSLGYFGSFSLNTQTENSDLDILVEFSKPVGWEFFTLESFLDHSMGLKIDLVTKNALKERIRDSVLKQVKYI